MEKVTIYYYHNTRFKHGCRLEFTNLEDAIEFLKDKIEEKKSEKIVYATRTVPENIK
jgi:hypothetical protein